MTIKTLIVAALLLLSMSCSSQAATPTATATARPTQTPFPAATETPAPAATSSNIFGSVPLNSIQAFNIEPVAQAVFEEALKDLAQAGSLREYRVDRIAVFPSGDGTLIAEIFYSLSTDKDMWPEDGGAPGADGWITGKCSRFDLIATDSEHQLVNKRLCS